MTPDAAAPVASVRVGTRRSPLAVRQTELVVEALTEAWPGLACEVVPLDTRGDRTQATGEPLPTIGGKGLFTEELERALADRSIDLAVHSLKDLPTDESSDVAIGAVCRRGEPRDCLVSRRDVPLGRLPAGAVVGTSSLRRSAQLRVLHPHLEARSVRGNVETRIGKVRNGDYDAVLLAGAGIARLGLEHEVAEWLPVERMLPAPGQGALAVQCRAGDDDLLGLLHPIDDEPTRAAVTAERAFLAALGSGCAAPVAAYAVDASGGEVRLDALVATPDGREVVRVDGTGPPEEVGARLAREALAAGAKHILESVRA